MENKQRDIFEQTITHKKWLTKFLNDWNSKLIANTIDLEWSNQVKSMNPDYTEPDNRTGQSVTIDTIIANKQNNIEVAMGFIKTIKFLLVAEEKNSLKDFWKDIDPFKRKSQIITPEKPLKL